MIYRSAANMVFTLRPFGTPSAFGHAGWPWYNLLQFSHRSLRLGRCRKNLRWLRFVKPREYRFFACLLRSPTAVKGYEPYQQLYTQPVVRARKLSAVKVASVAQMRETSVFVGVRALLKGCE